jgi:hypothetical protein
MTGRWRLALSPSFGAPASAGPKARALAHIHLAHAGLPPCGPDQALRLFVADELIEAGVSPETLMKAQGFDPAPLALLKYSPDQPRVPAGSGRESGEWTSGDANTTPVAFRSHREKGRHGTGDGFNWIDRFLELFGHRREGPPPEEKPPEPEVVKPESKPLEAEDLQVPKIDPNSLHHIFDDPDHGLDGLVTEFGSQESAFEAIAEATRDAVRSQGITGQYEIQVEVGGRQVTVRGRVVDGVVNIGTVFIPWKH